MKEQDAVREALLRYGKAFQTLDPSAILPFIHEPCLLISPQGSSPSPTGLRRKPSSVR